MFQPIISPTDNYEPVDSIIPVKATEAKTLKTVIEIMSSKLLDASISKGIPYLTPSFFSIKVKIDGISTAKLTAPRANPLAKHRGQGSSNSHLLTIAAAVPSRIIGTKVRSITTIPAPSKSSSSPPCMRITEQLIVLIHSAQLSE